MIDCGVRSRTSFTNRALLSTESGKLLIAILATPGMPLTSLLSVIERSTIRKATGHGVEDCFDPISYARASSSTEPERDNKASQKKPMAEEDAIAVRCMIQISFRTYTSISATRSAGSAKVDALQPSLDQLNYRWS